MSVILTVEDEFFISEYLRLLLERAGYDVIATYNADEAIAVLECRSDIHTIITDINMPGSMDGLRLAAAVRDRWPPIKIIVVTGHKPPELDELPERQRVCGKTLHCRTDDRRGERATIGLSRNTHPGAALTVMATQASSMIQAAKHGLAGYVSAKGKQQRPEGSQRANACVRS